jgi:DNA/RNA endonuclease YhcR with UshA esterase domain
MKNWPVVYVGAVIAITIAVAFAQDSKPTNVAVPKYNPAAEAVFKGVVQEVVDRQCPMTGTLGEHLILQLDSGGTIEVHLAPVKFDKNYDISFQKGDKIEVTGVKVHFEGVDTIFARQIKRGEDVFGFRDQSGKPVW